MVRLNIDIDAEMYPAVSVEIVRHPAESYTEVSDDLWQRYQDARDAFRKVETELVEWHRTHRAVHPDDETEG